MTRKSKRITAYCLAGLLAYSAIWYAAACMIEARVMGMLASEKAHGITISAAKHRKSGYPFAFHITLKDVTLSDLSGLSLTAPRLRLGSGLTGLSHVSFLADRGAVASIVATGDRVPLTATISTASGGLRFNGKGIADATIDMTKTSVQGLFFAGKSLAIDTITAHFETPDAVPQSFNQPSDHVMIEASGLSVPPPGIPALGNTMQALSVDALVMGPLPALNAESLAVWRDGGGTVDIHDFSTHWGLLSLALNGTLALDGNFQPQLSAHAGITGFDETLDAMAATGAIKVRNVGLAKMGLGMIARPDGPDNVPTLNVPLTIQNQALYVANFKIAPVPPVKLF